MQYTKSSQGLHLTHELHFASDRMIRMVMVNISGCINETICVKAWQSGVHGKHLLNVRPCHEP